MRVHRRFHCGGCAARNSKGRDGKTKRYEMDTPSEPFEMCSDQYGCLWCPFCGVVSAGRCPEHVVVPLVWHPGVEPA